MNTRILVILTCLLAAACGEAARNGENGATEGAPDQTAAPGSPLLHPEADVWKETAPDEYKAKFETTAGDFVVQVHRDWAPIGADRFYNLVRLGYFDGNRFFRVVPDFVVQWGMKGWPAVDRVWQSSPAARLRDEPVKHPNLRATITFAKTNQPNSRTTQLFINLVDNSKGNRNDLDQMGFSAFGEVVEGMDNVDAIYSGYGEQRLVPDQQRIADRGNAYLSKEFPRLTEIRKAYILE